MRESESKREEDERWRAWMAAAQRGDRIAYETLLRSLVSPLRRFIGRRIADHSAVEDVMQNVLVSLHRARHTYRPERRFRPWLFAIARNAVVDHARARSRIAAREISLEADGVPEPSVEPRTPQAPLAPELVGALDALPPAQREAVELIQLEGLSVAEAAARVGISKGALKVRAHRGYRMLRARLGARER